MAALAKQEFLCFQERGVGAGRARNLRSLPSSDNCCNASIGIVIDATTSSDLVLRSDAAQTQTVRYERL